MNQRMTIESRRANLKRGDARKANMTWVSIDLTRRMSLTLLQEHQFDPNRKWRADWAVIGWVGNKPVALVIEYEGTGFGKTGHTQTDGYAKNCQKYNRAALLGWTVLRYTCLSYEDLSADLKEYFKNLGA